LHIEYLPFCFIKTGKYFFCYRACGKIKIFLAISLVLDYSGCGESVVSPHLTSFASLTLPKIRCPAYTHTAGYLAAGMGVALLRSDLKN